MCFADLCCQKGAIFANFECEHQVNTKPSVPTILSENQEGNFVMKENSCKCSFKKMWPPLGAGC